MGDGISDGYYASAEVRRMARERFAGWTRDRMYERSSELRDKTFALEQQVDKLTDELCDLKHEKDQLFAVLAEPPR